MKNRLSFLKILGYLLPAAAFGLFQVPAKAVELADAPLFSTVVVPGNLILALSVEYPTATTPGYTSAYSAATTYLGYFDSGKCYVYQYNSTTPEKSYFKPDSLTSTRTCTSTSSKPLWSGNYLNWASMQTLDTFRWVLTGGYRSTDTATETVLTKTYAWHNGLNPNKSISNADMMRGATPFATTIPITTTTTTTTRVCVSWRNNGSCRTWDDVETTTTTTTDQSTGWTAANTRIQALGTAMYIGHGVGNTLVDYDGHNHYVSTTGDAKFARSDRTYRVYINVKVCDNAVGLEENCKAYGTNYKPEGLMQKYSNRLRYSAFGYYNQDGNTRNGGVLRAPMRFIGPTQPVAGSSPIVNSNTEWSATTGVMSVNPNPSDATAATTFSGVTISQSGVMNYLNKFGYDSQRYKSNDPVGEMYYAALRYLRNLGNVSSYTDLSGATDAQKKQYLDGFPVITNWDDPIAYSCQQNFVLGIGDVNTHEDRNLPATGDTTVDVVAATNMAGKLEGINSLATYSSGRGNSFYMVGLAYDAHTKDIRSDLVGKQTVNTYWVDVLENQVYQPSYNNQFYLTAKYGGFTVNDGFNPYADSNTTTTISDNAWWTTGDMITISNRNDKRPDNFFLGNNPERMKAGLEKAFEKIVSEASKAASTTISLPTPYQTSNGNANYKVEYDPNNWTSTLEGQLISYDSSGNPSVTTVWNATTLLNSRTASNRYIVTWNDGGVAFAEANLSTEQKAALGSDTSNKIAYLRGSRASENGTYRKRAHLLGDIVNSKLTAVGPPDQKFWDIFNPGYSQFQRDNSSRPTIIYVGSNDGMLHAFDGTLPKQSGGTCTSSLSGSSCGKELFAYIPGMIYGDSTTGPEIGLVSRTNPNMVHRYLVDGTPIAADVDFKRTYGATGTDSDWRSILVGGLGKGGKGYYAIDITKPSSWSSEAAVAGKVLWEFTNADMGYSFGDPVIAKTPEFGWTVILPSGYNNGEQAFIFLVNPRTGGLLKKIALPGSSDIAHIAAYTPNFADLTADTIYGGDLAGNLWRIDLTQTTTTEEVGGIEVTSSSYNYGVVKLAELTNAAGNAQPVTTRPLIEIDPASGKRYVLVGTGKLLSDNDIQDNELQSFYAIWDGHKSIGGFGTGTTITRATLNANTNLLSGIGSNPSSNNGWYFDLSKHATADIAERINIHPIATGTGIVGFAANLPNGDVCSPAGTSRLFAISFATGKTAFIGASGAVAFQSLDASISDIAFVDVDGKTRMVAGTTTGNTVKGGGDADLDGSGGSNVVTRLNWREVPTAD